MTRDSAEPVSRAEASTNPDQPLLLQPTPAAVKADPGAPAEIRLMLLNRSETERVDAPVIDVGALPEGWTVVDRYDQQGTWREATREWLWWALAPEEKVRPTLTVSIPEDTEEGTYPIDVQAHDADGNQDMATVDVKLPPASGNDTGGGNGDENGRGNGKGNGRGNGENGNGKGNGEGEGNGKGNDGNGDDDEKNSGGGNGGGNGKGKGGDNGNGGGKGSGGDNGNGNGGGNGNGNETNGSKAQWTIDVFVSWLPGL